MVKEYAEEYQLWRKCFFDTEEYTDYYFREKAKDNEILRMFKENELVSMLHLNPYEICWKGKAWPLYYIVGVCTEESHRKRGYMRKLLKEAFKLMEARGCPFTYLMPANKEIYEPFDFHFIYTQKRVQGKLSCEELREAGGMERLGEISCVSYQTLAAGSREAVAAFQNQKLAASFDLYAVRSAAYLNRLSLEMQAAGGELLVFHDTVGNIRGTIAYMAEIEGSKAACELVESILSPKDTKELMHLFKEELFRRAKGWSIDFLETGFWEEAALLQAFEEARAYEKPIIMAKALRTGGKKEKLERELKKARVYLNEIV